MKWLIIIIVLVSIIAVYIIVKRQRSYNEEELRYTKMLNIATQFGTQNIAAIQEQKISPIDQFINSEFVTKTSGIFGYVWGKII